jgi:hypothetical protein
MGRRRRARRRRRGAVDQDVMRHGVARVLLGLAVFAISACTDVPPEGISEEEVRRMQPINALLIRSTVWDTCRLYDAADMQRRFILAEAQRCPKDDVDRRMVTAIKKRINEIETQRDGYRYLTCGELVEQRRAPRRIDCSACQELGRRWDVQLEKAQSDLRTLESQIADGKGCAATE